MRVSIVMPVRNEGSAIGDSLGAVLAQDYPPGDVEILVADGRSDDGTREYVQALMVRHPNLRLVDNPGRIVPTGLNQAIRIASGTCIVRVDGHTVIDPDYVSRCVEALKRSGGENVGGPMRARGIGWFGRAVAAATSVSFGVGGARFHYSRREEWVDTVYMGAWPRRVFEAYGGFDEEMVRNQDDEFNYRILDGGGRILLSPAIRSVYTVRGSPRALWRQYFQYGFWKVRVMQKHPRQMRWRHFAPGAFVTVLAALPGAALVWPAAWGVWGVVAGIYLAAACAASLWTAKRSGWDLMPVLPIVFVILHLAYGTGFLVGLLRFIRRWGDRGRPAPIVPAGEAPA